MSTILLLQLVRYAHFNFLFTVYSRAIPRLSEQINNFQSFGFNYHDSFFTIKVQFNALKLCIQ